MIFLSLLKKHFRTGLIFTVFILSFLFISCAENDTDEVLYLDNNWQFKSYNLYREVQKGDFEGTGFLPMEYKQLEHLEKLVSGKKGYVLIRNEFKIPKDWDYESYGVFLGRIWFADKVYLNGVNIGFSGSFPENEFPTPHKAQHYLLPEELLNRNGTNVLLIHIKVDLWGSILHKPFISSYEKTEFKAGIVSFFHCNIFMIFSFVMAISGILYIITVSTKSKKEGIYYGLFVFMTAFYLLPYFADELPFFTSGKMSYNIFARIFVAETAFVTAYFACSFMCSFLNSKTSELLKYLRLAVLIVPCIVGFTIPDFTTMYQALPIFIFLIFLQILFGIISIIKSLKNNYHDVVVMVIGFSPVLTTCLVDLIVHIILNIRTAPVFTLFGWQFTILAFLLILSARSAKVYKRMAYLNKELEKEVEKRTSDLTEANHNLESERNRLHKDIALAVNVQQNLLNMPVSPIAGWDIACELRPNFEISGDMYDFYINNQTLAGLSVIDVSGQGISAGLITVLAKSIIKRQFYANRFEEENIPQLSGVVMSINDELIRSKGNVSNYLTGTFVQMQKDAKPGKPCEIDMVNAGNPPPIFFNNLKGKAYEIVPDEDQIQFGAIGLEGMSIVCADLHFKMKKDDSLIIYTDGLINAMNDKNEQYGRERLLKTFEAAGNVSAAGKLNYVMKDFETFIGSRRTADDLLAVVLKRC